jgi:Mg2+ and Co2+ transporter CorA
MNTLDHLHAIHSELETMLWEIERMIAPYLSDADKERYMRRFTGALNEVNTLRRRTGWYVMEMENNLYALGIDPSSSASPKALDHEKNFLALYRKLVNYQSWAEKLMGVILSHVNLMETEKSISDSKSLSRLTVLGFFFVPISFVATFFSMGGDFGVGERRFWIFWAVAVPLMLVSLAVRFGKWWVLKWKEWREGN